MFYVLVVLIEKNVFHRLLLIFRFKVILCRAQRCPFSFFYYAEIRIAQVCPIVGKPKTLFYPIRKERIKKQNQDEVVNT